jgi:hypothetical protein
VIACEVTFISDHDAQWFSSVAKTPATIKPSKEFLLAHDKRQPIGLVLDGDTQRVCATEQVKQQQDGRRAVLLTDRRNRLSKFAIARGARVNIVPRQVEPLLGRACGPIPVRPVTEIINPHWDQLQTDRSAAMKRCRISANRQRVPGAGV